MGPEVEVAMDAVVRHGERDVLPNVTRPWRRVPGGDSAPIKVPLRT